MYQQLGCVYCTILSAWDRCPLYVCGYCACILNQIFLVAVLLQIHSYVEEDESGNFMKMKTARQGLMKTVTLSRGNLPVLT